MDGSEWIGKKVYVKLKSNRVYTCIINSIVDNKYNAIDKFGEPVMFDASEINFMEVED